MLTQDDWAKMHMTGRCWACGDRASLWNPSFGHQSCMVVARFSNDLPLETPEPVELPNLYRCDSCKLSFSSYYGWVGVCCDNPHPYHPSGQDLLSALKEIYDG